MATPPVTNTRQKDLYTLYTGGSTSYKTQLQNFQKGVQGATEKVQKAWSAANTLSHFAALQEQRSHLPLAMTHTSHETESLTTKLSGAPQFRGETPQEQMQKLEESNPFSLLDRFVTASCIQEGFNNLEQEIRIQKTWSDATPIAKRALQWYLFEMQNKAERIVKELSCDPKQRDLHLAQLMNTLRQDCQNGWKQWGEFHPEHMQSARRVTENIERTRRVSDKGASTMSLDEARKVKERVERGERVSADEIRRMPAAMSNEVRHIIQKKLKENGPLPMQKEFQ